MNPSTKQYIKISQIYTQVSPRTSKEHQKRAKYIIITRFGDEPKGLFTWWDKPRINSRSRSPECKQRSFFLYIREFYHKDCIKLLHLIYNVMIFIYFQPIFPFLSFCFQKRLKSQPPFSHFWKNKFRNGKLVWKKNQNHTIINQME